MNKLYGLVLGGGLSSRMGQDKAQLVYPALFSKPSAEHLRDLLLLVCERAFVSVRPNQKGFERFRIEDVFPSQGPGAGILSAAERYPEASAWLVIACDFPFAEVNALRYLAENRDMGKAATFFLNSDSRPEPLFTIWERSGLKALAEDFSREHFSPRETLERVVAVSLHCPWPNQLVNINRLREADAHGLSRVPT